MVFKRIIFILILFCLTSSSFSFAVDRDVKVLLISGTYGVVAGSVVGLASVPLSRDFRTLFIGSSVGLYLGFAVGVYYIYHRTDPQNPLRARTEQASLPLSSSFDFSFYREFETKNNLISYYQQSPDTLQLNFSVYEF